MFKKILFLLASLSCLVPLSAMEISKIVSSNDQEINLAEVKENWLCEHRIQTFDEKFDKAYSDFLNRKIIQKLLNQPAFSAEKKFVENEMPKFKKSSQFLPVLHKIAALAQGIKDYELANEMLSSISPELYHSTLSGRQRYSQIIEACRIKRSYEEKFPKIIKDLKGTRCLKKY